MCGQWPHTAAKSVYYRQFFSGFFAMIDPKLLRTQLEQVNAVLAKRGVQLDPALWAGLEARRRALEELRPVGRRSSNSTQPISTTRLPFCHSSPVVSVSSTT